jgi:hypothetical protein
VTAAVAIKPPAGPSLSELRHSLLSGRAAGWVEDSHRDPASFWRGVGPLLLSGPSGSARSSLFERYNLFHELCARHAERGRLAFAELDPSSGFVDSSYAAVLERAACLAAAWKGQGVAPGAMVAVVASMGEELLTALLAAWRCGATAAPVPALGRTFMVDRLTALAPQFVATSEGRAAWLRLDPATTLPLASDGLPDRSAPHLWAAAEVALRCFSPLGHETLEVHELTAEALLLGALRDGVLLLGLDDGQAVAAPGFCEVQEKIPLLLATLAAGGTWLELGLDAARADPDGLLARNPVLGIHDQLRDALLASRGRLRRWFRNPAAEPAYDAWEQFTAAPVARQALGMNLFTSTAAAGAVVFSPWRLNPGRNQVLPSPGRPWRLASVSLRKADALGGSGVLACGDDELPPGAIGRPVLARVDAEYVWVTCLDAHRRGQRLPAGEICAAVAAAHPAVWRLALIDYPRGDSGMASGAALVTFLRPDLPPPQRRDVEDTIAVDLGEQFIPDRTDFFHVPARTRKDGSLDGDWCRVQYVGGLLPLKEREALFQALGALRFQLEQEEGD